MISAMEFMWSGLFSSENLIIKSLWVTWLLMGLEYLVLLVQKKRLPAFHENLLSIAHAILFELGRLFTGSFKWAFYIIILRNSNSVQLFDDSVTSFLVMLILTDFIYYWIHRLSHVVMPLWAIHSIHHSSDEITFSAGLRHSPVQHLFSWIFYLPLSFLGVPLSHAILHINLNLIIQIWNHTDCIPKLGIIEMIFNSPSHHRVHHGSTEYCLDVNYGGIFIIWDRIFGTFQKEREDERIVYGLVQQPDFWNPLSHQMYYLKIVKEKAVSMTYWKDFFLTFVKETIWYPEYYTPPEIPDVRLREPTKVNANFLINSYVFAHLLSNCYFLIYVSCWLKDMNHAVHLSFVAAFILFSLFNIGLLYDGNEWTSSMEILRSFLGLVLTFAIGEFMAASRWLLGILFLASAVLWNVQRFTGQLQMQQNQKKQQ